MLSVKEVLSEINELLKPSASEPVNLVSALGRVIASDVVSFHSIPPFDMCNIDGYAASSSSIYQIPMLLNKVGKSRPSKVYEGEIGLGEAVEVTASCPVPRGADVIIPREKVDDDGQRVIVNDYVNEGQNISIAGIDIGKGDIIFTKGTILNSRHIALAATLEIPWLPVIRAPRIGVLVSPIDDIKSHEQKQFSTSNSIAIALSTFISSRGGVPTNLGLAVELSASIEEIVSFKNNLENSLKSIDMLITVGGVENSKENLIFTTLTQKGAQLKKVPVAIGAGHHIIIGSKDSVPVIGIPGHHVASLLIAPLFLIPVIDSMLGINEKTKKKIFAILTRDLDEYDKKTDFLYGKMIRKENGELSVSPISAQDSLMISVLTETECMILVDKNLKLKAGSTVEIIMLTGSHTST